MRAIKPNHAQACLSMKKVIIKVRNRADSKKNQINLHA